ncbi:MAG: MotA/TolQ/ExbB proton channel family protein [Planctomycetota bacterium]|jgi:biopolymer transport protein ExbB/TolQ
MSNFFTAMGMYMLPLLALLLVIVILSIKTAIDLFGRQEPERRKLERGINAIFFWGCVGAVLGLLGQFTGQYIGLNAIMHAEKISPTLIAQGLASSMTTTIFGLILLLISALVWFTFRVRLRKSVSSLDEQA